MNIVDTNYIVKSQVVVDSKGVKHKFNMIQDGGCYTFTWDDKPVDWSFPVCSYNTASYHYNMICCYTGDIDRMNDWVNG